MITKRDIKPGADFVTDRQRVHILDNRSIYDIVEVIWFYDDAHWKDSVNVDELVSIIKDWKKE